MSLQTAGTVSRRGSCAGKGQVVTIYSVIENAPQEALRIEIIDGQPLSDLIETHGPYGASAAATIDVSLSQALVAAHALGIVHRDVKAANVL